MRTGLRAERRPAVGRAGGAELTLAPVASVVLEKALGTIETAPELDRTSCVPGKFYRDRVTGVLRPYRCGTCRECRRAEFRRMLRGVHSAIVTYGLRDMVSFTLPSPGLVAPPFPTWDGGPWEPHLERARRWGVFHGGSGMVPCPDHGRLEPGPVRAREAFGAALHRFLARLHRRGVKGDNLWFEEAQRDGTAHGHMGANTAALRAAHGNDWAAVRAYLQEVAFDSGFGYIDWSVGKGRNPRALAFELTKYLAKSWAPTGKGHPTWRDALVCLRDEPGFQKKRFHRWGGSGARGRKGAPRGPADVVRDALHPERADPGRWELVTQVTRPGAPRTWECVRCGLRFGLPVDASPAECPVDRGGCGRTTEGRIDPDRPDEIVDWAEFRDVGRLEPWSPGTSKPTAPGCGAHLADPDVPFVCHHPAFAFAPLELEDYDGGREPDPCPCRPPWLAEWTGPYPRAIAAMLQDPARHPAFLIVPPSPLAAGGPALVERTLACPCVDCVAARGEAVPAAEDRIPRAGDDGDASSRAKTDPSIPPRTPGAALPICAGCGRILIPGAPVLALEDGRTFHDVPYRRCRT